MRFVLKLRGDVIAIVALFFGVAILNHYLGEPEIRNENNVRQRDIHLGTNKKEKFVIVVTHCVDTALVHSDSFAVKPGSGSESENNFATTFDVKRHCSNLHSLLAGGY